MSTLTSPHVVGGVVPLTSPSLGAFFRHPAPGVGLRNLSQMYVYKDKHYHGICWFRGGVAHRTFKAAASAECAECEVTPHIHGLPYEWDVRDVDHPHTVTILGY